MITVASSALGILAGLVFGMGWAFGAGCLAALGQILDGVDGQLARLRDMETPWGAFWDSTLDRYGDGALIVGMSAYVAQVLPNLSLWVLIPLAAAALIGGNLVSYTTARAENLNLDLGSPTLASKGTRTSLIVVSGWASVFWKAAPLTGLLVLAGISNAVILRRLIRVRTVGNAGIG